MFKSIKRALAAASTVALLATNAGVAFAQTFQDMPPSNWAYDYVEQLVSDGVVDAGSRFRPNDPLNRCELSKMVITAIDGLADYQAPATPTFDDLQKNSWCYDYVEAAVQLGIVEGYKDVNGNLTGKFGPGDTVNRAAATKILVNAFSVPTTLEPSSVFPDVRSSEWFYDYVVTAYNQSILDGYANGRFGPADPVTRAQVAKLVVNAQDPHERDGGTNNPPDNNPPPQGDGDLEVSLNDATPASSTLPLSASSVKLATFDLTAADSDVVVSNLVVTRGGVGRASDWDALYLYEGPSRLTTGRTLNNDTNTATFALNTTVDAGTTLTLTLVGDVSATAGAANQHYFYVASAADITSNAQSVAGDFPVAGNTFTMGGSGTVVNTVTVSNGSAISQPTIGQSDAELASFKLTAGSTNDIAVQQVTLTQNGSLDSGKMKNQRLLRGTDEVAKAAGFIGDRVTFVLAQPYVIRKGQSNTFYVRGDVIGGRSTDTVQLYLDENTDLTAMDQQYGYGALVSNVCSATVTNGFKPVSSTCTGGVASTALKGGQVTVADNGPAAHQIAQNTTNVQLLNYSVTAARDLTVKDMDLTIDLSTAGSATTRPNVGALGSGTITTSATSATGTYTLADAACVAGETYTATISGTAVVYTALVGDCSGADSADTDAILTGLNTAINANVTVAALVTGTVSTSTNTITLTADTAGAAGNSITTTASDTSTAGTLVASQAALTGGVSASTTGSVCYTTSGATAGITVDDMVSMPTASGTVYAIVTAVGSGTSCATGTGTLVTTNNTAGTAVTAGTLQEINPYTLIKNVKVVDLDSGSTLQGPMTRASDGTVSGATDSTYTKTLSEDYELTGGETRHLSIQADTDQTLAQGYRLAASINYTTAAGYIKDMAANENVAIADIVGGSLTGKYMSTAANSLTVALANTPSSQTYVRAEEKVEGLGITLRAGDAGDIAVKKLNVRLYAVDNTTGGGAGSGWAGGTAGTGAWTDAEGNIAANTLALSVTLYDGNDVVDGPRSLTLVDGTSGAYVAGTSYYKVLFDNLNLKVLKGSTKTLTAKVKLQSNIASTSYLTLDLKPSEDIVAEDIDANTITASGSSLNATTTHAPLLTIVTSGTLTLTSEGNPDAKIVVAGTTNQLVAKYRANALRESFTIDTLTIMQDATGAFGTPVDNSAVRRVILKYNDINGISVTKEGFLSGGVAKIAGLGFYVPAGQQNAYIEIYADVNNKQAAGGEKVSGQTFRLGIQDTANTSSPESFRAVGVASGFTLFATGVGSDVVAFNNAASVNGFVVRSTMPVFTKASGLTTNISGSDDILYGLTVTADAAGTVSFGRLTFTVSESTGGTFGSFKFFRGSTLLSGDITVDNPASIWNADANTDLAVGGAVTGSQNAIVAFKREETIGAGQSQTYFLKASAIGTIAINETVNTKLNAADEATPVSGITGVSCTGGTPAFNGNANTGRVYDSVGATCALFNAADTDFAKVLGTARSIIWSDNSADSHVYPTVAATTGAVTAGSGSYDWTNGYLLKVNNLTSHTLTK